MNANIDEVLTVARELYGVDDGLATHLGRSQNDVFRIVGPEVAVILRISSERSRDPEEIEAELEWIESLGTSGISVCLPLKSINKRLCESIHREGVDYHVSCFLPAPGRPIEASDLTGDLYRTMGRTLGAMHTASKALEEKGSRFARKDWRNSRLLNEDMDRYLPAGRENFRATVCDLIQEIAGFSVDKEGYGLVHADFSFNNLFFDNGQVTVFDFDNCEYAFFAQEIGTTIYSSVFSYPANTRRNADLVGFSNEFWAAFAEGYTVENSLASEWQRQVELSLILREAVIYTHYHRIYDVSSMSEGFQKGVDEMRQNVEARRPAVPLNFR